MWFLVSSIFLNFEGWFCSLNISFHACCSFIGTICPFFSLQKLEFLFALLFSLPCSRLFQNSCTHLFCFPYILIENFLIYLLIFGYSIKLRGEALRSWLEVLWAIIVISSLVVFALRDLMGGFYLGTQTVKNCMCMFVNI